VPFLKEIFLVDIGTCQESSNDAGNDEKPGPSFKQLRKYSWGIQCFTAHVYRYSGTDAECCTRAGDPLALRLGPRSSSYLIQINTCEVRVFL
jgi:hypothetical protein